MCRILFIVLAGLLISTSVMASGFGIFVQGAEGLGQGNAVIAHSAGASTVYFNPALMTQLESDTGFDIGTTAVKAVRSFTPSDPAGVETDGDDGVYFPSTLYAYHKLSSSEEPKNTIVDEVWLGFAFNSTFGLGTKWPANWDGRYIATENEITTFNLNPNIALKMDDWSVAFGIDFLYLNIDSNRFLPVGAQDIAQQISGDTWAYGFNAAVAWEPTDKLGFGLSYRSKFDVDLNDLAVSHSLVVAGLLPNTTGSTKFTLPQQLTFGQLLR